MFAHAHRQYVHVSGADEETPGAAELRAAQLEIDGRAPSNGADDMERGETVSLDELLVSENVARGELDLAGAHVAKAQLLQRALDGLAEQAVRVRVNGGRLAGIARDGHQRPAALAFPVGDPSAAFPVRQRAVANGDELADGGVQLHDHAAQEGVCQWTFGLPAIEETSGLLQRQGCAGLEAT